MALRGGKPKDRKQRLKLLLSGTAGVGKTMAAIQMPKPYIIDTEQGSVHYGDIIEKAGGAVAELYSVDDVIQEVRTLMTEQHPYLTIVIDPTTTLFNSTVDEATKRYANNFQAFGEVNRIFKRLCNLLTTIDMNVVVTAHEKAEYETRQNPNTGKMEVEQVGVTFDSYKKLHYVFDLWLQLEKERNSQTRTAYVAKTRLAEFPDGDRFPWNYEELKKRYGVERLEKGVEQVELANAEQIERFNFLCNQIGEEGQKALKIDKVLASVDNVSDLPAERIAKGIELIEEYRSKTVSAA